MGKPIDTIENAYAFNKCNIELVNKVNETLDSMRKDGTLKNISEKWLYGNVTIPGDHDFNLDKNNSKISDFSFDFMYSLKLIPMLQNMSAYKVALIGLALNGATYIAEVFRTLINAINKGQMEACLSLGMTKAEGLKRIVLPQAFRIAIPSLGNIFVDVVKDFSLAFTLRVVDLLAKAQISATSSYKFFESYIIVALIYWIVIEVFNYFQKRLEKRLSVY